MSCNPTCQKLSHFRLILFMTSAHTFFVVKAQIPYVSIVKLMNQIGDKYKYTRDTLFCIYFNACITFVLIPLALKELQLSLYI